MLVGKKAIANATGSTTAAPAFGTALLFGGTQLVVGAPAANSNTGLAVLFDLDAKGNWVERTTLTPFEAAANRFGQSFAMVGDEIWIGAPANNANTGAIYRLHKDAHGWGAMTRFTVDSLGSPALFGYTMAVGQGVVAVSAINDGGGEGTVVFLTRPNNGDWSERNRTFIEPPPPYAAVTGAEIKCGADGKASAFECANTGLLSFLPISAIGIAPGAWHAAERHVGMDRSADRTRLRPHRTHRCRRVRRRDRSTPSRVPRRPPAHRGGQRFERGARSRPTRTSR